jgi:hypothetical protein
MAKCAACNANQVTWDTGAAGWGWAGVGAGGARMAQQYAVLPHLPTASTTSTAHAAATARTCASLADPVPVQAVHELGAAQLSAQAPQLCQLGVKHSSCLGAAQGAQQLHELWVMGAGDAAVAAAQVGPEVLQVVEQAQEVVPVQLPQAGQQSQLTPCHRSQGACG